MGEPQGSPGTWQKISHSSSGVERNEKSTVRGNTGWRVRDSSGHRCLNFFVHIHLHDFIATPTWPLGCIYSSESSHEEGAVDLDSPAAQVCLAWSFFNVFYFCFPCLMELLGWMMSCSKLWDAWGSTQTHWVEILKTCQMGKGSFLSKLPMFYTLPENTSASPVLPRRLLLKFGFHSPSSSHCLRAWRRWLLKSGSNLREVECEELSKEEVMELGLALAVTAEKCCLSFRGGVCVCPKYLCIFLTYSRGGVCVCLKYLCIFLISSRGGVCVCLCLFPDLFQPLELSLCREWGEE